MSSIRETAEQFFDACETGKGWDGCQAYCHEGATFSAQAGALEGVETVEGYADWMKGIFTPLPDASYEVRSWGRERGRTWPPTACFGNAYRRGRAGAADGPAVETDYVYVMDFDGDRIRHLTKIWNDGIGLQQLGWA